MVRRFADRITHPLMITLHMSRFVRYKRHRRRRDRCGLVSPSHPNDQPQPNQIVSSKYMPVFSFNLIVKYAKGVRLRHQIPHLHPRHKN